ncbi:hypothetical protein P5673_015832 [Acropora cervicornis]|uniref:Uncharacterized protein n=1 Tax=Acropora cervicornis TaxID=6130 RepID=A0AAD9QI37_ACRCE|nr:hypothetical protein P5673_015832 [Acropora cervicornis]
MGHFASVCRSGKLRKERVSRTRVKTIEQHEDNISDISAVTLDDSQLVTLKLVNSGSFFRFQPDTGAQCNVIPSRRNRRHLLKTGEPSTPEQGEDINPTLPASEENKPEKVDSPTTESRQSGRVRQAPSSVKSSRASISMQISIIVDENAGSKDSTEFSVESGNVVVTYGYQTGSTGYKSSRHGSASFLLSAITRTANDREQGKGLSLVGSPGCDEKAGKGTIKQFIESKEGGSSTYDGAVFSYGAVRSACSEISTKFKKDSFAKI